MKKAAFIQLLLLASIIFISLNTVISTYADATQTTTVTEYYTSTEHHTVTILFRYKTTSIKTYTATSTSTAIKMLISYYSTSFTYRIVTVESEIIETYASEIIEEKTITIPKIVTETRYATHTMSETHTILYIEEEPESTSSDYLLYELIWNILIIVIIMVIGIIVAIGILVAVLMRRARRSAE